MSVELPGEEVALVGGQRQPREVRDALDVFGRVEASAM